MTTNRRNPNAKMGWLEIAKFSTLLAFSDAIDDLDDYFSYYLIAESRYGCDCIGWVYGLMLLAKTIFYFLAKPAAGWIADACTNYQHWNLIISGFVQLISSLMLIWFGPLVDVTGLIAIYLFHKLFIQINTTALWKVVKFRTQFIYGKDNVEDQEVIISFTGVFQTLGSDIFEVIALACTFGVINRTDDFRMSNIVLYSSVIFGNAYIAFVSLTITPKSLYHKEEVSQGFSPLLGEEVINGPDLSFRDPADRHYQQLKLTDPDADIFFNVKVGEAPQRPGCWTSFREGVKRHCPSASDVYHGVKTFFSERVGGFFSFRLALHPIMMSWVIYCFTNMIEYPINFAASKLPDDSSSSSSASDSDSGSWPCDHHGLPTGTLHTPKNFCHGQLKNLIQESMTDNVAYFISSVIYLLFLVKCPSRWFYHFVFPYIAVASAAMIVVLWILASQDLVGKTLIFIIKSFLLTAPHLLEKYNFYFWTSAIDEKYFGFYYGTYGLIQNAIHTTSATLLEGYSDSLTTHSPLFSGLLAFNFILITFDYFYCLWFAYAYTRVLFARKGVSESLVNTDETADPVMGVTDRSFYSE